MGAGFRCSDLYSWPLKTAGWGRLWSASVAEGHPSWRSGRLEPERLPGESLWQMTGLKTKAEAALKVGWPYVEGRFTRTCSQALGDVRERGTLRSFKCSFLIYQEGSGAVNHCQWLGEGKDFEW